MGETREQLDGAPASGASFPPEKLRRDEPTSPPAAGLPGMHLAAPVGGGRGAGPPFVPGETLGFRDEDRRGVDSRRVCAYLIDAFILAPVVLALYTTLGFRWSVQLVCASITLTYFFVLEAQSGQTLGKRLMRLRVMHIDGGPARAAAIGGRTALRVIDWHLGLFVMVLTGRRRQRIGDLATGTVVRADDRPYVPAPRSPLTTIYPAVWMGTALIAAWQFGLFHPPHGSWVQRTSDPYMARIDQICKQRVQRERPLEGTETVEQVQRYSVAETRAIEQLPPPPPRSRRAYRETLKWKHRLDALGSRVLADVAASSNPQATLDAEIGRLKDLGTVANQRFLELGLPHCAQ